ncbi:hypothetical protein J2W15_001946 [Pseudarthrobacter sulfonivorans]|nr:hypothetical protein [Pseudarthrobacter sulfonivorans]
MDGETVGMILNVGFESLLAGILRRFCCPLPKGGSCNGKLAVACAWIHNDVGLNSEVPVVQTLMTAAGRSEGATLTVRIRPLGDMADLRRDLALVAVFPAIDAVCFISGPTIAANNGVGWGGSGW